MKILTKRFLCSSTSFEASMGKGNVCKLKKSLGLRQSPRARFDNFTTSMCKLNYKLSQGDPTMFSKHNRDGRIIVFIVYVDDVILIGNDIYEMEIVKTKLATEYEIKNLGNLRYFLGIEAISKQRIFISPQKYVLDLLKEVGMLGSTLRVYEDNHNEEFATFNKSMFSIY